ncbi:hypothetical protein PMIN05_010360, partial [Paraphaeosphaeria minitans]
PLFYDALKHLNKHDPQPPQLSAEDEDEFLASFDDEDEFLAASEAVQNGRKRAHDDNDSADTALTKRPKSEPSPSAMLANRVLKERFGFGGSRLEQEAAITRLMDGGSATIVFPTGGARVFATRYASLNYSRLALTNEGSGSG